MRKQYQRNRERFREAPDAMPVFGTMASRFNDDGVTALYQAISQSLVEKGLKLAKGRLPATTTLHSTGQNAIVPPARVRYLADIAETVRNYHAWAEKQAQIARERQQLMATRSLLALTPDSSPASRSGEPSVVPSTEETLGPRPFAGSG